MIGLGVIGCNLVLNMGDQGFAVAGYGRDSAKADAVKYGYRLDPATLLNLLLDSNLSLKVQEHQEDLRSIWQPTRLIQAQRDYFGALTYERIDTRGAFHTEWEKASAS